MAAGRGDRLPGHAAGAQPHPGGGPRPDGAGHGEPTDPPALVPRDRGGLPAHHGHLPALFALPAGLGDISVGLAAPLVARRLAQGTGRRAALRFSAFGITDLVVALVLGALTGYQLVSVTPSAAAISALPLALVPGAEVPLLFVLHLISVRALARSPRPATGARVAGATPRIAEAHGPAARA